MVSKCQTVPEPMGPTCSAMHQCSCIPAGMRRGLWCVCVCVCVWGGEGGDILYACTAYMVCVWYTGMRQELVFFEDKGIVAVPFSSWVMISDCSGSLSTASAP